MKIIYSTKNDLNKIILFKLFFLLLLHFLITKNRIKFKFVADNLGKITEEKSSNDLTRAKRLIQFNK
ncbi:hypothetical protein BpHYR1_048199 [Brachionus plicatilis]|uniref:Uncharacterized protein n=1 Tax=Brachionus plicatilis TaxID=10195 RepID=A0A3M7RTI8_BRAPC|nr:hypothetical protein BpHYR1_048199 [Brachionus plicatilis]